MAPYWSAFDVLSRARGGELSEQPIKVAEVLAYCELVGVSDAVDRLNLLEAVQLLDAEWLKLRREEREAKV